MPTPTLLPSWPLGQRWSVRSSARMPWLMEVSTKSFLDRHILERLEGPWKLALSFPRDCIQAVAPCVFRKGFERRLYRWQPRERPQMCQLWNSGYSQQVGVGCGPRICSPYRPLWGWDASHYYVHRPVAGQGMLELKLFQRQHPLKCKDRSKINEYDPLTLTCLQAR